MANHRHYMKLYIGEYLADTTELDATGSGAYLFLIMYYWQHGHLPTEPERLRRIARLTPRQASKWIPRLSAFFQPGWRHKRIDRELQLAEEAYEKLSVAGVIGRAKQLKRPGHRPGKATHNYNYNTTTSTEKVPHESKKEASRGKEGGSELGPTPELIEAMKRKGHVQ